MLEGLYQAWRSLLERHDSLRLRFKQREDGSWQQAYAPAGADASLLVLSLVHLEPQERLRTLEGYAAQVQVSLHIQEGPVLRASLIDLGPEQGMRLLIVVHHLVIDGVSWRILLEELHLAYRQWLAGETIQLERKTASYHTWAQHLVAYAQSAEARAELPYWLARLQEAQAAHAGLLPPDQPGGSNTVASSHTISKRLSVQQTQALLHRFPQAYRTQINDVLLTALGQSLAEWTGRRVCCCIWKDTAGKPLGETSIFRAQSAGLPRCIRWCSHWVQASLWSNSSR